MNRTKLLGESKYFLAKRDNFFPCEQALSASKQIRCTLTSSMWDGVLGNLAHWKTGKLALLQNWHSGRQLYSGKIGTQVKLTHRQSTGKKLALLQNW